MELAVYDLVSANDEESRDPRDWVLQGWVVEQVKEEGGGQQLVGRWVDLGRQQGVVFDERHQRK